MINSRNLFSIFLISLSIFFLSGCSAQKNSIVNTGAFEEIREKNKNPDSKKYQMQRLNNGVVVYKDFADENSNPIDKESTGIKFGPKQMEFDLNNE